MFSLCKCLLYKLTDDYSDSPSFNNIACLIDGNCRYPSLYVWINKYSSEIKPIVVKCAIGIGIVYEYAENNKIKYFLLLVKYTCTLQGIYRLLRRHIFK